MKESQRDKIMEEDGLEKLAALEERIRAIKGNNLYNPIKAIEMCLVPIIVIHKKFRVPEFVKYT
jgi:hypothetical protein